MKAVYLIWALATLILITGISLPAIPGTIIFHWFMAGTSVLLVLTGAYMARKELRKGY